MAENGPIAWKERIWIAGVSLVSFFTRLLPWNFAVTSDGFLFEQYDAYYHLRRIGLLLHHETGIDRYMSFPAGAECPWPPLYDGLIAGLSYLLGWGNPSTTLIEGIVTLLPPVLAAVTVVPVYLLCRLVAGRGAALLASLFFIAMPLHLRYSVVGSGDHHTAEVLLLSSMLYLYVRSLRGGSTRRERTGYAVAAGAVLGAVVLVWQGSVLFPLPVIGGILICCFNDRTAAGNESDPEAPSAIPPALAMLAAAFVLVSAGRAFYPSETGQTVSDFGFFSWFQPFFLLLQFVFVLLLFLVERKRARAGNRPSTRSLVVGAGSLAVAAALALLIPSFRENAGKGWTFLLGMDPWLASISEYRPSIQLSVLRGPLSPGILEYLIYAAIVFLPFPLALAAIVRRRRRREPLVGVAVFAAATLLFGLLALLQRRWANAYSVNMAVAAGGLVAALGAWEKRRRSVPALAAAIGLILAVPSLATVYRFWQEPETSLALNDDGTYAWLRENTPRTSGLWGAGGRPEYSVFCDWMLGHKVMYLAQRPTVVNNFGSQLRENGLADMVGIYLARDEREIAGICVKRGIRYLVVKDIRPYIEMQARIVDVDFRSRYMVDRRIGGAGMTTTFGPAFWTLPYNRMLYQDGTGTSASPGLSRFRLVHESYVPDPDNPEGGGAVKIFEFVKGATVTGRIGPGQTVLLSCRLVSDSGRTFTYRTTARADGKGIFSSTVPYATAGRQGGVVSAGDGVAASETQTLRFAIADDDVREGKTVGAAAGR